MQYKIILKNGSTAEITAERYETDGAGTRFFDDKGQLVASGYDGQIVLVMPQDAMFTNAPTPDMPEHVEIEESKE